MVRDKKRLALGGSGALLVVVVLWTGYWFYAAHQARRVLDSWTEGVQPLGLEIATAAPPSLGGFPFSFTVTAANVSLRDPQRLPGSTVTAPMLVAWCRPWSPRHWRFDARNGLVITQSGPNAARVTAGSAKGEFREVSAAGGVVTAISFAANDAQGDFGGASGSARALRIDLSIPRNTVQVHTAESLGFAISFDGVTLARPVPPLGSTIVHFGLVGAVDGAVPKKPLRQALTEWRDDGGTVEVHSLALDWAPLELNGDGTLALDPSLQPIGAFSTRISEYSALVDALARAGILRPAEATYIRIGLGLLSQKDEAGRDVLKAPVTIQNAALYLGPAKLLRMPVIDWH